MNHVTEAALEHYLLGADSLDADTLEAHILDCDDCARRVRAELDLEARLVEVGHAAQFCPGCSALADTARCNACGAVCTAGDYRIERVIVHTTHGRLYAARDAAGRRVALKELAFIKAPTLEALTAFERETTFLRSLSHPGIPKFHAAFVEGTGIHTRMYIAQDLVEGESLLARLDKHRFDEHQIVDLAKRVLDILIYLQSLSPMVFHRDIKPANLLVQPDGSIALVDFGAAREVSDTMGNTAVGTFGYMPVEQMGGIVDATTDTYALGASLLHLLTRREPWKLLDAGPVGLNVSPPLRAYLLKLTAKKPEERFANARAARAALEHLAALPPKRRLGRTGIALMVGGLLAAGAGTGAVLAVTMDKPEKPVEDSRIVLPTAPERAAPPQHRAAVADEIVVDDDFLEPRRSGRSPNGKCGVVEQLPSGDWPDACLEGTGELRVTTIPTSALVIIDGIPSRAATPVTFRVRAGVHLVKVEKAGYAPIEKKLDIESLKHTSLTVELATQPGSRSPNGKCNIYDRLPTGEWPARCK